MSERTPGPWTVGPPNVHGVEIYGPATDPDAEPGERDVVAAQVERRNSALIAAAPELADLLALAIHEGKVQDSDEIILGYPWIRAARAALKKAGVFP